MRYRAPRSAKNVFSRTAVTTRVVNLKPTSFRGGFRF